MKPTHAATVGNKQDVTAWQFSRTAPIPVWVAKIFHFIEDTFEDEHKEVKWAGISTEGKVVEAKEGDWVVAPDVGRCFVLTNAEFNECFKPLIP